jgi:hypothetical protein
MKLRQFLTDDISFEENDINKTNSFGLSVSKFSIRSNIFCLNSLLFFPSILHIFCSTLDYEITTGELQKAFSKLKSWKSPGLDNVSNEMLKASHSYMNPCLLKLFNAVFTSGIYPSKWPESFVCPITQLMNQRPVFLWIVCF